MTQDKNRSLNLDLLKKNAFSVQKVPSVLSRMSKDLA